MTTTTQGPTAISATSRPHTRRGRKGEKGGATSTGSITASHTDRHNRQRLHKGVGMVRSQWNDGENARTSRDTGVRGATGLDVMARVPFRTDRRSWRRVPTRRACPRAEARPVRECPTLRGT